MDPLGYHVRVRLHDDRVIAPTIDDRRLLAYTVLTHGKQYGLFAFGYPDTHLHLAASCSRLQAGKLAQSIESSLKQRLQLPVGFQQYYPKPIQDNKHLKNVFEYILNQAKRHGLQNDPRREGSNLPDLLGLRLTGAYTIERVRQLFPRVRRATLLEWLGLSALWPVDEPLDGIVQAALAAGCVGDLQGSTQNKVALRAAIVAIVGARMKIPELTVLLRVSRGSIYYLRKRPRNVQLEKAIKLQIMLGIKLGSRAVPEGRIR